MILDKEELLAIYDVTKTEAPRKNPKITGYVNTGDREDKPTTTDEQPHEPVGTSTA